MGNVMITAILALFVVSFSFGTYMLAADCLSLPTHKSAAAVLSLIKREKKKNRNFESVVLKLSLRLSKIIHFNEYKKRKLAATLKSADIKLTPETYTAKAWVKSGTILLAIIPAVLVLPMLSFIILFLAVMVYFKEIRSADEAVEKRRETIENELPRFALTLEQELAGSRDVLRILETYRKNTGPDFKQELDITIADMKSGSYESALSRLEARVGSTMLSDVVRGLLSVLRGDDGRVYFRMLAHDFKQLEIQRLKMIVTKRPAKVRKYSFFMLGCFILMYLTVMAVEIIQACTNLF